MFFDFFSIMVFVVVVVVWICDCFWRSLSRFERCNLVVVVVVVEESGFRGGEMGGRWLLMEEALHVCLVWNMRRLCGGKVEFMVCIIVGEWRQTAKRMRMCCDVLSCSS
jgi:hypothetical protein